MSNESVFLYRPILSLVLFIKIIIKLHGGVETQEWLNLNDFGMRLSCRVHDIPTVVVEGIL